MTVFAGVILSGKEQFQNIHLEIENVFNRTTKQPHTFKYISETIFLIAYDACSININFTSSDAACWISGEAFIRDSNDVYISDEADYIKNIFKKGDVDAALKRTRGVFSGVCIDTISNNLSVFTDKLGVRPVYIYRNENFIIFSSLISVLKELSFLDMTYSPEDTAIFSALGFCLGNKTPYKNVTRLNSGEILNVEVNAGSIFTRYQCYWSFLNDVKIQTETTKNDLADLYEIFKDAVFLRNINQNSAISFLSGGMDSRAVTAMVNEFVEVQTTYNYSKVNSQDQFFAREYATKAKLRHNETTFGRLVFPNWSMLISDSIKSSKDSVTNSTYKRVWSGDGGSVGLGMVYITKNMEKALLKQDFEQAIRLLIQKFGASIPYSFIKKDFLDKKHDLLFNEILNNTVIDRVDPVKSIYHFLLCNDQKRHMDQHFETICDHGVEMLLPFFDSEFLAKVYSLPSQDVLFHKAYSEWFNFFPDYVTATPWQTYPEHVECPVKIENILSYQWADSSISWSDRFATVRNFLCLRRNSPVFRVFNNARLYFAMVFHMAGLRNYSYIFNIVDKLNRN